MKHLVILTFLITSLFSFSCEKSDDISFAQSVHEINGGYAEPGEPGVVLIWHQLGYMCTGTLIKPTVVLTAKHCVRDLDHNYDLPISGFRVRIGPDMWNVVDSFNVKSVYTTPGTVIEDQDVALMVLSSPIPSTLAEPYPYALSDFSNDKLIPDETQLSIIGYGESVCGQENNAGVKLRTEDTFLGFITNGGDFYTQGRGANHGDSGGPIFDDTMKIIGVTSRGSDECTGELAGITVGASVAHHLDLISQVLESEGYCAPTTDEDICGDNKDNNCDGFVDDGCIIPGSLCNEDWECQNGLCLEQSGEKRCVKSCNPYLTSGSCGSGHYCSPSGCGESGICAPGTSGSKQFYESCNADTECESLFCAQTSDGVSRCLYPCEPGNDNCLADEFCVELNEGCGGCVPYEYGPSTGKNIGESCKDDTECDSGICHYWGTDGYCTENCESDSSVCLNNYHCSLGLCVRGELGTLGDTCASDGDCRSDLDCINFGTGFSHCSMTCNIGESCGEDGFVCSESENGNYCKKIGGGYIGDSCKTVGCSSGLFCVDVGNGDNRCVTICHRNDGETCPSYTSCYSGDRDYCIPMDKGQINSIPGGGKSSFGCSSNPENSSSDTFPLSIFIFSFLVFFKKLF